MASWLVSTAVFWRVLGDIHAYRSRAAGRYGLRRSSRRLLKAGGRTEVSRTSLVERRQERRIRVDIQAEVTVLSFVDSDKRQARISNVSKSGLGIKIGSHLETGTYVEVRWLSLAVFGEVKYCRSVAPDEFEVGIQVENIIYGASLNESEHLSSSSLTLFLVGALAAQDMRTAGKHIAACPLCKRALGLMEDQIPSEDQPRGGS